MYAFPASSFLSEEPNVPDDRPPPGQQARHERFSVAFFTRPKDAVVLRPLGEKSRQIADSVAMNPREEFNTGATAGEWTARRIKKLRLRNRKVRSICLPALRV